MAGDWIKLYRQTMNGPTWQDAELFRLFVWCLFRANWKDTEVFVEGITAPVPIKRGQFITGRNAMHSELFPRRKKKNPAPRTVWRWLLALETMQNVTVVTSKRYSIVTVCNYDTYQSGGITNGQDVGPIVAQACPDRGPSVSQSCPNDGPSVSTEKKEQEIQEGKEQQEGKEVQDKKGGLVSAKTSEINEVVEHYQTHHARSRPGDKERKLIGARLKDGYSVDDLRRAIDGNHKSPFHCGENDRGDKHQSLELIVRNSSQVSKFIEVAEKADEPVLSAKTQKSVRASQNWLLRKQEELDGKV